MPISKSAAARRQVHFATIPEPRHRKVAHPLISFIVIAICGVMCSAEDFVAIADVGQKKWGWFRKITLARGDTFARPVHCDRLVDLILSRASISRTH